MKEIKRFTLTDEHIKLVRHFYIDWWECETGAPRVAGDKPYGCAAVDPKRPYGNSTVAKDIHQILTGESLRNEDLSEAKEQFYLELHEETCTALQIILATGTFTPGIYEVEGYSRDWKFIKPLLPVKQSKPKAIKVGKIKLVIGKEYWVLQENAALVAIEGDEAVMRNRWDATFKVNIGDVQEKQRR